MKGRWRKFLKYLDQPAHVRPVCLYRIGLAVLPRDRFVSLDALENAGGLVTRPLTTAGQRLHLNAAARGGRIRVAVLDEDGEVLPGLGLEQCAPIEEDSLHLAVGWKDGKSWGDRQRLRLQFELVRASLFSFWID